MQNTAQANTEIQNFNPTDEQVEKFFSSGGREHDFKEPVNENTSEPVKQEATQPETPAETKAENTPKKEGVEHNINKALFEERERRRELQREIEELKTHKIKMEERFNAFMEKAKAPVETPPSYDENPLDALRYEQNKIKEDLNRQHQLEQQRYQQAESYNKQQQFVNKYQTDAASFAQNTPDFKEAYQHLVNARISEYKAAGYTHDQANRLLMEDEMAIASKAYQDGVNPAERIYALAKVRGYQMSAQQQAQKPKESDEDKFKTIEKGIKNSKSLSNGSGGKIDKGLSVQALIDMDDDEFNAITPKQWAKLMASGG